MQGSNPSVDGLCPGTPLDRKWDEAGAARRGPLDPARLAQHAADVARVQGEPTRRRGRGPLATKVARLKSSLGDAYARLASSAHDQHVTLPAEEWLLDNAHAVEEQIREVEEDLPSTYLAELPRI